jgi:hypothetical protein
MPSQGHNTAFWIILIFAKPRIKLIRGFLLVVVIVAQANDKCFETRRTLWPGGSDEGDRFFNFIEIYPPLEGEILQRCGA